VRQALVHALDRPSLAELLSEGIGGSAADVFLLRTDPLFPEVDRVITKYPYDRRRAATLLAEAGWSRPQPDGLVAGPTGQTLQLEFWSATGADGAREAAIIADSWKAVGIDATVFVVPAARAGDAEFRAGFSSTMTSNRPIAAENFIWTSSNAPTPQTRWQGQNRGNYRDAEIDRLQTAVLNALGDQQWRAAVVALHHRMSQTVGMAPLYYPADILLVNSGVKGPLGHFSYPAHSWNIFEWEVVRQM
jgi:ABC-type transport system substrate-binding protein